MFQMPTRLCQPPRFVEDATSGLTVTTCLATPGASRLKSLRKRPKALCVEAAAVWLRPRSEGMLGTRLGALGSRDSSSATARQSQTSSVVGTEHRPRIGRVCPQVDRKLLPLLLSQESGVVPGVPLDR